MSGYEFVVSFETNGVDRIRERVRKPGYSITQVITKVRKEYPQACMFKVIEKQRIPDLMG